MCSAMLGYVPTPKQQQFHDATEFDVMYGGQRGRRQKRFSLITEGDPGVRPAPRDSRRRLPAHLR